MLCVPRLLDSLHPFVALALLLRPQLQRLLSIVTEHDEEVVLKVETQKREREKTLFLCTTPSSNSSTTPLPIGANHLTLQHKMFWLLLGDARHSSSTHMAQTYGNIAFNYICFSHSFHAQIPPIKCLRPHMKRAEPTDRTGLFVTLFAP